MEIYQIVENANSPYGMKQVDIPLSNVKKTLEKIQAQQHKGGLTVFDRRTDKSIAVIGYSPETKKWRIITVGADKRQYWQDTPIWTVDQLFTDLQKTFPGLVIPRGGGKRRKTQRGRRKRSASARKH